MLSQICPAELQLNLANYVGTEAPLVSFKIYNKRDDLKFEIVNFSSCSFLDGNVLRSPYYHAYGVYISQLIRFVRVCYNASDFNNRSYCMVCASVREDNPRALASGLSPEQMQNHTRSAYKSLKHFPGQVLTQCI